MGWSCFLQPYLCSRSYIVQTKNNGHDLLRIVEVETKTTSNTTSLSDPLFLAAPSMLQYVPSHRKTWTIENFR